MANFTLEAILAAVGGTIAQPLPTQEFNEIRIDSRKVQPGDLFIALTGERFDGHDFLSQVATAGATAAVVMKEVVAPPELGLIYVSDTLEALGAIARLHRRKFNIPVVAITGSNGKTTTKDLIAAVLEQQLMITKTEANFNNEIGLPLTLLKVTQESRVVVVEMGMRGLGQIKSLAAIAEPEIAVVTNVGLTHLELLGTQENIGRAKAELVEALPQNGLAILNGDDPIVRQMTALNKGRSVLYGIEQIGLDYRADEIRMNSAGSTFKVYYKGGFLEVQLPLPGKHNVLNALAAIAVGRELGVEPERIKKGLAQPEMTGKRLHIIERNEYVIIDDTYNASPTSVKASLEVLINTTGKRKIAVLADMLELGPSAVQIHREIGKYASKIGVDCLFGFGDLGREYVVGYQSVLQGTAQHFPTKTALIAQLRSVLQPNDVILIKGSRGMKMEEVVAALSETGVGVS